MAPPAKAAAMGPVDVSERPVHGEGGDGEHGDDDEAGAGGLGHREAEYEHEQRDEQEAASVGEQAGEESYGGGRGDHDARPSAGAASDAALRDR